MRDDTRSPWRTLSSRNVYENPWISVREDSVIRPDGEPGIYGVVHYKNTAVGVLPVEEDHIYLVGQYRYPLERYSWEIPEGGCPKDEEPLRAAQRELRRRQAWKPGTGGSSGGLPLQLGRRRVRSVVSRHGSRTWGAAARWDRGHRRSTRSFARGRCHGDGRQDHRRSEHPRPNNLRTRGLRCRGRLGQGRLPGPR